jgi:uncharacterized Ntn-hydrolase superfamily protein
LAVESEPVGLIEDSRVAVGRGQCNQNALTSADLRGTENLILGCGADRGLNGPVQSEQLADQRRMFRVDVVGDAGAVCFWGDQANEPAPEEVGGCFVSGDGNEDDGRDDFVEAQIDVGGNAPGPLPDERPRP